MTRVTYKYNCTLYTDLSGHIVRSHWRTAGDFVPEPCPSRTDNQGTVVKMEKDYDLCIVGAGMMGSAAARHVTEIGPTSKICIVRPEEPKTRDSGGDRFIFGSYYDVGRITRLTDQNPVWSVLAKRSLMRFRDLERQVGFAFYEDVGCLTVAPSNEQYAANSASTVRKAGTPVSIAMWPTIESTYNLQYFDFDQNDQAILEHGLAGHLNPRLLVQAELTLAQKRGCDIIRDVVTDVTEINKDGSFIMNIQTVGGRVIRAKKVLLATGAFSSFKNLFPPGVTPVLGFAPLSVVLAEVSETDQKRFRNMPCLSYRRGAVTKSSVGCYMLPPIKYPDGRYYIKIGHADQYQPTVSTEEEVKQWFCNEAPKHQTDGLVELLKLILPDFTPVSVHADTCVSESTPNELPYIDMVTPRLGVAFGGNGFGAKSCEEIGRLAADMIVHGKFLDPELSAEHFKFKRISKL